MKVLTLFSGTHSIGKVCKKLGFYQVSLDKDRVLEIIDYFKPKYYWIENPATSKMKTYITDLPFYDVDYCKYSDYGYQKRTRFWTNIKGFNPKLCKKDCQNILTIDTQEGDRHEGTKKLIKSKTRTLHKTPIGSGTKTKSIKKYLKHKKSVDTMNYTKHEKSVSDIGGGSNRLKRYRIPPKLIEDLLKCCI